jgi:hypothetical protein
MMRHTAVPRQRSSREREASKPKNIQNRLWWQDKMQGNIIICRGDRTDASLRTDTDHHSCHSCVSLTLSNKANAHPFIHLIPSNKQGTKNKEQGRSRR